MKKYLAKIYSKAGVYKDTIRDIMSEINYSYQKNWWQGQLNLTLNRDYADTSIVQSDIVKIYLYDKNFQNWKLIYTWIVEEIERNYEETRNSLTLVIRGLSSILTRIYYNQTWYTFSKTDTASNIIKSIINYANTHYNWFNTTGIIDTVWNITISFDYDNCFDAIDKVVKLTGSFWYIKEDWTCVFNQTPTIHKLTAKKEIQTIEINEDWNAIINKVIVNYNWGTYPAQDNTSITNYGLIEAVYDKPELNLAWATSFASEELLKNQLKQKSTLQINNKYIIENVKPWDILRVKNLNYYLQTTIERLNYTPDILTIDLDKYNSIGKILINK